MKKLYLSILIITIFTGHIQAQINQVNELATIAKTWGLLKYYHPEIATGKHDWDSVLAASTNRILH